MASFNTRNGNGTALQTRPPAAMAGPGQQTPNNLIQLLTRPDIKEQMSMALPSHVTADRLMRIATTELRKNPELAKCDQVSFLGALMQAAVLGLEPGINGQCYLIPYKGTCTFVPGWKGLVDLVSRTGRATVWTGAVFEGDQFDYQLGSNPYIHHRPGDEIDPARMTHAYAIGRVNGSDFPVMEVWSIRKINRHRDEINKQGSKHYSFRHPEMYARKVALLQAIKYLPSSVELSQVQDLNRQLEMGEPQDLPLSSLIPQQPAMSPVEAPAAIAPALAAQPVRRITTNGSSTPAAEPAPAAPAPAAQAAASAPAPVISPENLEQIIGVMDRRLNPLGQQAFVIDASAEYKLPDGDISQIPAEKFSEVMAALANDGAVNLWNEGRGMGGDVLVESAE